MFQNLIQALSKKKSRLLVQTTQKIFGNVGWLLLYRFLRIIINFLVSASLARYLGPTQFGIYSYAIAFVAIFGAVSSLGLNGIVVRDIVQEPEKGIEILGTTLLIRIFGGILGMSLTSLVIWFIPSQSSMNRWIVTIISLSLIFRAFDCINSYFQSQMESRYITYASGLALLLGAFYRIYLIVIQAPIVYFAVAVLVESIIASIMAVIIYQITNNNIQAWKFNFSRAVSLLQQCWPLMLSQIGVMIYFKMDQVMLNSLVDTETVGLYSAAAQISESIYFLPNLIMASVFPVLLATKLSDHNKYNFQLQKLYYLMFLISLCVAISVTILSNSLISILYGDSYKLSGTILAVHIWASIFIFQGAVLSKWLIGEGLLKFSFLRHGVGVLVNISMNQLLIPRYEALGAAIATVVSYASASYFACFLDKKTIPAGVMMTHSMISPFLFMFHFRAK